MFFFLCVCFVFLVGSDSLWPCVASWLLGFLGFLCFLAFFGFLDLLTSLALLALLTSLALLTLLASLALLTSFVGFVGFFGFLASVACYGFCGSCGFFGFCGYGFCGLLSLLWLLWLLWLLCFFFCFCVLDHLACDFLKLCCLFAGFTGITMGRKNQWTLWCLTHPRFYNSQCAGPMLYKCHIYTLNTIFKLQLYMWDHVRLGIAILLCFALRGGRCAIPPILPFHSLKPKLARLQLQYIYLVAFCGLTRVFQRSIRTYFGQQNMWKNPSGTLWKNWTVKHIAWRRTNFLKWSKTNGNKKSGKQRTANKKASSTHGK